MIHIPGVQAKEIEAEVEAIKRLHEQGGHLHIITILRICELRDTHFLFIDMEICDLNLEEYIYCKRKPESVPT